MCGIAPPLRTETKIVGSGAIFPPPLRFPALRVHHPGLGNRCRPFTEVGESRGDRETGQVLGCRQAGLASTSIHPWKFPRTKRTRHLDGGQGGKRCFAHHPRRWTEPRCTGAGRAAGLGPRTCRWRDGTRWPCHTYEQDNWCHRTEAPCEPPGATSERPRVGASRLSDGCPAARYQSAECL